MNYREYMRLAHPIEENVEFILEKAKSHDIIIATKCRYEYLNQIWLQENNIELPLLITSKDKIDYLKEKFDVSGSYIIDDCKKTIDQAIESGMHGLYLPTNHKIYDAIEAGMFLDFL